MYIHDATEEAYKNGYEKGKADGKNEVAMEIFEWFEKNAVNLNFLTGNMELSSKNYLEFKKKYTKGG